MKKLCVIIECGENNYSAYIENVSGIAVVGDTIEEIEEKMKEAVAFYVEVAKEDGTPLPSPLKGEYEFEFKMDVQTLLTYFDKVIGKPALERLTGINQKQLWHYATGKSKPRPAQVKKIQDAFHNLGRQFMMMTL